MNLKIFKFIRLACEKTTDLFTLQYNTTQCNTIHHNTIQHNTIQYNTIQHNTTQHNTTQYNATQYNTIQHNAIQYNTIQHNTTQHSTAQHNTTQHNTTQYNTIQYNTLFIHVTLGAYKNSFKRVHAQKGWIHLQHTRIAKKNATTCLFVSHLGYAYGVGDKSTARSSVRSYFIGYFDAVNSDYFSQMSQILAKGLHFPARPKM